MRLDMDCVRNILLCVEENASLKINCRFVDSDVATEIAEFMDDSVEIPDYQEQLQQTYENSVLIYHVRYCIEAGLLKTDEASQRAVANCVLAESLLVRDLSVSGHDLLSKIRDDKRWHGIKKALPAIRNYSLDAIRSVADGMTSAAITSYLANLHANGQ